MNRSEGRPLPAHFLGEFMPESRSGDSDGETIRRTQKDHLDVLGEFMPEFWSAESDGESVTRTQKDRLDPFRKADKTSNEHALERDSPEGLEAPTSPLWNPSREQWIVIWVCAMAAWLLWSSDNGILGYTALFGHNTDHRFGTLATVVGVLRIWQLESRRTK